MYRLLLLLCCFLVGSVFTPSFGQSKKKKAAMAAAAAKKKEEAEKKKSKIKPYGKVITDKAVSDEGLWTTHQVGSDYFFELPQSLLEEEILVVSRISGFVKGLNFGGAGMKSRPQQVIRFQRHNDNLLLRSVSYNSVADLDDPIYESVRNNNFEPVIATFPIKAFGKDSTIVIDVAPFFTKDVPMIGALSDRQRKDFKVKGLDAARSMIVEMKSFPENVLVRHIMTYKGDKLPDNQLTGALSLEMVQSFILLPERPMLARNYDERVGYFSISQTDYSSDEQRAAKRRYITRWRLEPKDPAAYARGELVEPVKPIVYYVDPATPTEWVPYLMKGIEDWQSAFEAAGFKNAIIAKEAPSKEEDPDWSPEDVRYSVIRYISTDIQNAQGPHVHDPRTGEILESDILWYHNVMNLLRNWYLIQTAAVNPAARGIDFTTEEMGELIRFVAAHEVGHTLGLPHNMGSSVAYSVDSLRSPTFTANNGTAPSIMDYARFNYIAQPGDGVTNFYPGIGPYDDWSIEYGYRRIPSADTPEAEEATLNGWIRERAGNPIYRYGRQTRTPSDPTAQTEDLGDDSMKASALGIANLKRIVPQLREWSNEPGRDFKQLGDMYNNVYSQLGRYTGHVAANVGGVYDYRKTTDEDGAVFTPVPKAKQAEAVAFLNSQIFQTPTWLIDTDILDRVDGPTIVERMRRLQGRGLDQLLDEDRLNRMVRNAAMTKGNTYTVLDLMRDSREGIFAELKSGAAIDTYRRQLQRVYVDKMAELMALEDGKYDQSDIKAAVRANLKTLKRMTNGATNSDAMSRVHLDDLAERIELILNPKA